VEPIDRNSTSGVVYLLHIVVENQLEIYKYLKIGIFHSTWQGSRERQISRQRLMACARGMGDRLAWTRLT
jgi:hypothetical protein